MDEHDIKIFKEIGLDEIEEYRFKEDPKLKQVWRSRWWWYNWFERSLRRTTNFWSNEANTYGMKNHSCSYNTKVSNAILKVFGRYNCPVDGHPGQRKMQGTNQRVYKINKYNKYGVNKRLSVFNTKQ